MIDFNLLKAELASTAPDYQFYGFDTIDSTNSFLVGQSKTLLKPAICIAHRQTDGYGQRDRHWVSNAESLTFSMLSRIQVPLHQLDGFSQVIGLTLASVLSEFSSMPLTIKWPNDIYSEKGKVAGLLIESVKYDDHSCWLVVGVGINFSQVAVPKFKMTNPTDYVLFNAEGRGYSSEFLCTLVSRFSSVCEQFSAKYFADVRHQYYKYDYFNFDQEVIVYDTEHEFIGLYKGLSQLGEILIEVEGCMRVYRTGTVSIRAI